MLVRRPYSIQWLQLCLPQTCAMKWARLSTQIERHNRKICFIPITARFINERLSLKAQHDANFLLLIYFWPILCRFDLSVFLNSCLYFFLCWSIDQQDLSSLILYLHTTRIRWVGTTSFSYRIHQVWKGCCSLALQQNAFSKRIPPRRPHKWPSNIIAHGTNGSWSPSGSSISPGCCGSSSLHASS